MDCEHSEIITLLIQKIQLLRCSNKYFAGPQPLGFFVYRIKKPFCKFPQLSSCSLRLFLKSHVILSQVLYLCLENCLVLFFLVNKDTSWAKWVVVMTAFIFVFNISVQVVTALFCWASWVILQLLTLIPQICSSYLIHSKKILQAKKKTNCYFNRKN